MNYKREKRKDGRFGMTEKVKLTSEQATAIEYLRDTKFHDEGIISSHARTPMGWEANYTEPLNGLPLLTLVDALRIGYEVEEEYKVGDWIVRLDGKRFANDEIAVQIDSVGEFHLTCEGSLAVKRDKVRHATPEEIKAEKERRVWAKIGREPGEFRDGDAYVHNSFTFRVHGAEDAIALKGSYETGDIEGFYPAEYFISFGGGEE
ncbi:hypothetical protein ACFQ38_12005 [Sporosarcina contaminans]|uniref:DUF4178 domain-containing protein n=1 Tax=Sporosarcina contaminans TaxID=633403 RepID=A0ABW3TZP7_9BACL